MLYKKERPAILMFQDGRYLKGVGFGATKQVTGEIVFIGIVGFIFETNVCPNVPPAVPKSVLTNSTGL